MTRRHAGQNAQLLRSARSPRFDAPDVCLSSSNSRAFHLNVLTSMPEHRKRLSCFILIVSVQT